MARGVVLLPHLDQSGEERRKTAEIRPCFWHFYQSAMIITTPPKNHFLPLPDGDETKFLFQTQKPHYVVTMWLFWKQIFLFFSDLRLAFRCFSCFNFHFPTSVCGHTGCQRASMNWNLHLPWQPPPHPPSQGFTWQEKIMLLHSRDANIQVRVLPLVRYGNYLQFPSSLENKTWLLHTHCKHPICADVICRCGGKCNRMISLEVVLQHFPFFSTVQYLESHGKSL